MFKRKSQGGACPSLGPVFENLFRNRSFNQQLGDCSLFAPYRLETARNCGGRIFDPFSGYYLSFIIGRIFKQKKDTVVAMTFLGGMHNISAGALVAVSYFPAKVAVPVVIGMLFQQILASTYGHIVDHYYRKQAKASEKWVS